MTTGRSLWVGLDLLDRQLVDVDGRPVAKIDDLELETGDIPGARPTVSALLCGPAALGARFGRSTRALLEALRGVLRDTRSTPPVAIAFDLVADIGPAVKLAARRDDLPVTAIDEFLGDHIIGHIPGAGTRDAHEETRS
jgi:hypothetical protein